jgi:hypothetical protein
MKNKLLAVLATLGMVASASAIEVNKNLSINGFIDGSYSNIDNGNAAAGSNKSQSLAVDEVELNFIANVGNVSGFVSYDVHGAGNHGNVQLEQAHITYNLNDSVSFTFGRYGSALGLEREDPAGLYTVSRAYSDAYRNTANSATGTVNQGSAFNLGNIDDAQVGSVDGLTIAYSADAYSIAVSLENASSEANGLDTNDLDIELSFSYTALENTVIGGGVFFDNEEATVASETDAVNFYITRQFGKLLLGAEYTELSTEANSVVGATDFDRDAYMILADYDFNDKVGVALRLSSAEKQANGGDFDKLTIAPNYAITESLGAILEFSDIDDAGNDIEEYAVELTYTF